MNEKEIEKEKKEREEIVNNYSTSMFVEAGAGAGKTSLLIKRIVKQLETGFAKPSEIVAITFTKKAAEEMKTRMAKEYKGDDLDKMQISTIHSFCFKLIMEQAFRANLRLDVSLLEDEDYNAEIDEYFTMWYKSLDPKVFEVLKGFQIYKIRDLIKNAFILMSKLSEDVVIDVDEKVLKHKPTDFPIQWKKNEDGTIYHHPEKGYKKEEPYEDRTEYVANYIVNLVKSLVTIYYERPKNRYISNDYLLDKAADLLKDDEARKYYQKKYKCIYIDEFQDTSKVQVDLLKLLTTNIDGTHREGSLFIVGDPKQSIYRFRGADIPLYNKVKAEYQKLSKVKYYELKFNHRSFKDVLDFVNFNNKEILPNYHDMISMSTSNDYEGADVFRGVYHIGSPQKEQRNSKAHEGYKKETDKRYVSAIINGIVHGRYKIWDKDLNDKKGGVREVKYSDFLILCKGTGDMDEYMAEMMSHNIPVQISSIVNTNDNKELLRIRNICKFFAYPYDRGATEALISTISKEVVNKYNRKELKKIVDIMRYKTKNMDAFSKLLYVSHNLDLYFDNHKTLDKDNIKRITTQVEQMVETVFSTCNNDEMSVYEGVRDFVEKGYEREITLENDANAVRFMNLHKAKGLEGRIVIVCKRSEKTGEKSIDYDTYHYDDKNGVVHYALCLSKDVGYGNKECLPVYIKNEKMKEESIKEQLDEIDRLAYVEATRPMEALIIMNKVAWHPLMQDYDYSKVNNLFDTYPKLKYYLENENADTRKLEATKYKGNEFSIEIDEKQNEAPYNEISPSQFETKVSVDTDEKNPSMIKGAEYGTCMHRVFELLLLNIRDGVENNDESIRVAINKSIIENIDDLKFLYADRYSDLITELKKVLKEDADTFLRSYVVNDLVKNAKAFHPEYPFMTKIDNDICTGVTDLLIENNDGTYTIVDYKSDFVAGKDKEKIKDVLYKRYSGQLMMYKKAFAKILGLAEANINCEIYNKNIK